MTRFAEIDLSQLPPPDVVETLNFEALLADAVAQLVALMPAIEDAVTLESEPLRKLLEVVAYRETLLRARINDASRATMLATATGADLDNLAALFGVQRLVLTAATETAAAVMEGDDALRARAQLAPEAYTTAGSIGAYRYHALSADARVRDVSVTSPAPGTVRVTVLGRDGDGTPPSDLLAAVAAAVSADDVRPLCDSVAIAAPEIVSYSVDATITVGTGPDATVVRAAAEAALTAYLTRTHAIGAIAARSGMLAALHQPSVLRVELTSPAADIETSDVQAPYCTSVAIALVEAGE